MTESICICEPCTTPGGQPWLGHCAACCYGTMVEGYHPECPVEDHRLLAIAQHGTVAEKFEMNHRLAAEGRRLTPTGIEVLADD